MPSQQLAFRMISSLGRVDQTHLRTGNFPDEDWSRINTAVQLMSAAPIHIDDTPGLSPTEIRARSRRLQREHGLDLIVVDYLQLMQVEGTKENRATEISEISRGLKALASRMQTSSSLFIGKRSTIRIRRAKESPTSPLPSNVTVPLVTSR